jgi:hypothetical protein
MFCRQTAVQTWTFWWARAVLPFPGRVTSRKILSLEAIVKDLGERSSLISAVTQ